MNQRSRAALRTQVLVPGVYCLHSDDNKGLTRALTRVFAARLNAW